MRIVCCQCTLTDAYQQGGVASGDLDVGSHGAETLATHAAKICWSKAMTEVFVLRSVGQVPESFEIERSDASAQARIRDLQAARNGDAQNENQGKRSSDNEKNGQSHCKRRSSSRFQRARASSCDATAVMAVGVARGVLGDPAAFGSIK